MERQQATIIHQQNELWQGPLPSPQALDQFRQIVPDAPERIFAQWEQEAAHRRELEQTSLDGNLRTVRVGQVAAIVFALSAMGVAGFSVWMHEPWVAGVIGGTTVVSVVGAFLYQRRKNGQ